MSGLTDCLSCNDTCKLLKAVKMFVHAEVVAALTRPFVITLVAVPTGMLQDSIQS